MQCFVLLLYGHISLGLAQIPLLDLAGRGVQFAYQMYQSYANRNLEKKQKVDSCLNLIKEGLQKLDPKSVEQAVEVIKSFAPRKERELQLLQVLGYAMAGLPGVAKERLNLLRIENKSPTLSILRDITQAWIYLKEADYEQAKDLFHSILDRAKVDTFPIVYWGLAEIALREESFEEAISYAKQACNLAPQDPQSHTLLGEIYLAQRRYIDGERAYREALQKSPNFPSALLGLGKYYLYSAKRYADAVSYFRKAIEKDSSLLEAHIGIVLSYLMEGQIQKAYEHLQQKSGAFLSADFHALRGILLFKLGGCTNKVLFPNPSDSLCKHSMESFKEFLRLAREDRPGYIQPSDSLLEYGLWLSFVLEDERSRRTFCEAFLRYDAICNLSFQTSLRSPILSAIKAREAAMKGEWDTVLSLIRPHLANANLPHGASTLYALALWEMREKSEALEYAKREPYICPENGYLFTEYILKRHLRDPLSPEMISCLDKPALLGNYASKAKYAYNLSQIALRNGRDTIRAIDLLERILTSEFVSTSDRSYKRVACQARKQLIDLYMRRRLIDQAERMLNEAYRLCPKDTQELMLQQVRLLYTKRDTMRGDELLRRLSPDQLKEDDVLTERFRILSAPSLEGDEPSSGSPLKSNAQEAPGPARPSSVGWEYSSGFFRPVSSSSKTAPDTSRGTSLGDNRSASKSYPIEKSYSVPSSIDVAQPVSTSSLRSTPKRSYQQWLDTLYDYLFREDDQFTQIADLFLEENPDRKALSYELYGLFYLQKLDTHNAIKYLRLSYQLSAPDEQDLTKNWLEAIGLQIPPIIKAKMRRGILLLGAYGMANDIVKANNLFIELLKEYKTELSGYLMQLLAQEEEAFLAQVEELAETHPIMLGSMLKALLQETPEHGRQLISYLLEKGSTGALIRVLGGVRSAGSDAQR
ncbi:MAG: tetratricopeptide repeat protein [Bacteroidia bacterium]